MDTKANELTGRLSRTLMAILPAPFNMTNLIGQSWENIFQLFREALRFKAEMARCPFTLRLIFPERGYNFDPHKMEEESTSRGQSVNHGSLFIQANLWPGVYVETSQADSNMHAVSADVEKYASSTVHCKNIEWDRAHKRSQPWTVICKAIVATDSEES
jgi:hypothetical protein